MGTLRLAAAGARAHRGSLAGAFLVLALAGALLSVTGVLVESGIRSAGGGADAAADAGMLATVAGSFAGTALVVVVLVVAAAVALALRQRRRELALMRAIGATRQQIRRLVGTELVLVTVVAAPLGAVPALLAARRLTGLLVEGGVVSAGYRLSVSPAPVLAAVAMLVPLALAAGALATRETLRTPPTAAVRESIVEPATVGTTRRVIAASLAAVGLISAATPLAVPGTMGSATAATSAILLVAAAAVAGPLLVAWCLDHAAPLRRLARGASGRLALLNTRGFSRRLTTAIVPLAVALAAGTVQSSADSAVVAATHQQLASGLHADVVVTAPRFSADDLARVAATPGVGSAVPVSAIRAQVRTDEDEVPGLEGLSWEPTAVHVLGAAGMNEMYDLGQGSGRLSALDRPDTIAASSDVLAGSGLHVGDPVHVRLDGKELTVRLVATYERGLGFGDLLTGPATLSRHGITRSPDTVLLRTAPGAADDVRHILSERGITALDRDAYIDAATSPQAGAQHLSLVLLLALLAFIALAAANTLVMTTASRRGELALLRRTGATRRQLLTMATLEAVVAAGVAWAIGTIAVVPAVFGVSLGLLGPSLPRLDVTTYGALSGLVALIALVATVPTVAWQLRRPVAGQDG